MVGGAVRKADKLLNTRGGVLQLHVDVARLSSADPGKVACGRHCSAGRAEGRASGEGQVKGRGSDENGAGRGRGWRLEERGRKLAELVASRLSARAKHRPEVAVVCGKARRKAFNFPKLNSNPKIRRRRYQLLLKMDINAGGVIRIEGRKVIAPSALKISPEIVAGEVSGHIKCFKRRQVRA